LAKVYPLNTAKTALPILATLLVVGYHIPAFSHLPWPITPFEQEQYLRLSIFTVGNMGWLTAWALLQLYHLVNHVLTSRSEHATPIANPFNPFVLLLALGFSALSWIGLLQGFPQMFYKADITVTQLWIGVVTGLAGNALLFFFARCLNQVFPGYGFWGLIAIIDLYGFALSLPNAIEFYSSELLSRNIVILSVALCTLFFTTAIFLMRLAQNSKTFSPAHVLTLLTLIIAVAPMVSAFSYYTAQDFLPLLNEALPVFAQGQAFNILATTGSILVLFVLALLFNLKTGLNGRSWLIVGTIALMMAASELNALVAGFMWSQLQVVTVVFLAFCATEADKLLPNPPAKNPADEENFDNEFRRGWRN
jgi:hypothetical protein